MYSKVVKFLDKHNVLYAHQYGLRAKHNTTQPIIHLLDHCTKANSSKTVNFTLALFCDLSKAFEVINHNVLLRKLATYGIRGIGRLSLVRESLPVKAPVSNNFCTCVCVHRLQLRKRRSPV